MKKHAHRTEDVMEAASLFFAVRGIVRTKLAQGKKLDPYAWLRIESLKFIADREPSMRDVAEYLSITAPSATSLVSGLVRDGFVARRTSSSDRRASVLTLTPNGKKELSRAVARGRRLLAELFGTLSPAELQAFIRALARVRDGAGEC